MENFVELAERLYVFHDLYISFFLLLPCCKKERQTVPRGFHMILQDHRRYGEAVDKSHPLRNHHADRVASGDHTLLDSQVDLSSEVVERRRSPLPTSGRHTMRATASPVSSTSTAPA